MFTLILAMVAVMATGANAGLMNLELHEKQAILDAHNFLRARTALGKTPGQPEAANMVALEWDDRIEASARQWVRKCSIGHDNPVVSGYKSVGQNYAAGYKRNISSYVTSWYNEFKYYNFDTRRCSGVCSHYTQVVWANTTHIGCAAATCSSYPIFLVCNYGHSGNYNGESPYVKGAAGSQCPRGYPLTQDGLCLRKNQCNATFHCVNGHLDLSNCSCICPTGYYGDRCEMFVPADGCQDHPAKKGICKFFGKRICTFPGFDILCAKTCNNCWASIDRDPNVVIEDKVMARFP